MRIEFTTIYISCDRLVTCTTQLQACYLILHMLGTEAGVTVQLAVGCGYMRDRMLQTIQRSASLACMQLGELLPQLQGLMQCHVPTCIYVWRTNHWYFVCA